LFIILQESASISS